MIAINKERESFAENSVLKLQGLLNKYAEFDMNMKEDFDEIESEIMLLDMSISGSVELAKSIIDPIIAKQVAIHNISSTESLLTTQQDIQTKLTQLKKSNKIEEKIKIILEANELIQVNPYLFDSQRELFLKESIDVLTSLEGQFNTNKEKLLTLFQIKHRNSSSTVVAPADIQVINVNETLSGLEKTAILIMKLTQNNNSFLINFYDILAMSFSYTKQIIKAPQETKSELESMNQTFDESLKNILNIIKSFIAAINKRVLFYREEFDTEIFLYLNILLFKSTEKVYSPLFNQIKTINETIDLHFHNQGLSRIHLNSKVLQVSRDKEGQVTDQVSSEYDAICQTLVSALSKIVLFKYFVTCAKSKFDFFEQLMIEQNLSATHIDYKKNLGKVLSSNDLLIAFENLAYDLGDRYIKYEGQFIKYNLHQIFKGDSRSVGLEKLLQNEYYDSASIALAPIEDFFYVLKLASSRAIETLNLQNCLPIFNNIREVLVEDLIEILEIRLAIMIPPETKSGKFNDLVYPTTYSEPVLSPKYNLSNLYAIICFNMIVQSWENALILLDDAKIQIDKTYFNKGLEEDEDSQPMFDHTKIVADTEKLLPATSSRQRKSFECSYFKENDYNMVAFTFQDSDSIGKTYEIFLNKKIILVIENYLTQYIKSSVDVLNPVNYNIDGRNVLSAELTESFAPKFIEETDKILRQWKNQLHESAFNAFITIYCRFVATFLENSFMLKRYSPYGVIILEKDLNKIINYFSSKSSVPIREKFARLLSFLKILSFESNEEIQEYIRNSEDLYFSQNEIEKIKRLKN